MSQDQICFDDWQKQAQLITPEETTANQGKVNNIAKEQKEGHNPQNTLDAHQRHIKAIQALKNLSNEEFKNQFQDKQPIKKPIKPLTILLKSQKQFIQFGKNVGQHFLKKSQELPWKKLSQNQILTFFEEFLIYLYPNLQWQNVSSAKQKIKILKKSKKQQQARAKKIKEKQQRLKRNQGKQDPNEIQVDYNQQTG